MFLRYGLLVLCLLSRKSASDQVQDVPVVEVVVGYPAEIPCSVPMPLSDDEASLILWYRTDSPNPIYTLDVRNGPMTSARHFPAPEIKDRAYFNISVHPPVLRVDPVTATDEADYKCRVDLKRSRTLILLSKLDVIVPPGDPIIMDEHGQHLHDVVGPYDEGTTLIFICEVDGGDPSPEVTWWRGSTLLDDSYNVTQQGFVRNEVVLDRIEREDWMTEYTCRASNTNSSSPKEASLQLDMNLLPLENKIIVPHLPILAGEQLDVTCETRGSRPRALTSWWLDQEEIGVGSSETHTDDRNITLSTLRFTPKAEDDRKTLVCKSANPVLSKATLQTQMQLRVQYPPSLNLTLGPSPSKYGTKEGTDIQLLCESNANPGVFNITWEFEDKVLTTNMAMGTIIHNQTLFLQKARKDHQGKYRCQANNEIGKGYSNTLDLMIQFTPVCKSSDPTFYGISLSESVNLTCEVEANPFDVLFQWSFNSSLEIEGPLNWNVESNASVLHYSPKTEAGYGVFMCWGRNSVGTQKEPCIFKVVPAGPPETPHDCVVTNQTAHALAVECKSGYNGSLSQQFHMEIYNSVAEYMAHNLTRADRPEFEAVGLTPSTSYVLVIYSSNAKGKSKSLALVATTITPPKRRTAREVSSSLNPILCILIGILVLLFVVATVIISVVNSRRRPVNFKKEPSVTDGITECEMEKKELEESQDTSGKGPDIIPHAKDSEVFHLEGYLDDVHRNECLQKQDSPPTEYIRLKYMHTVL